MPTRKLAYRGVALLVLIVGFGSETTAELTKFNRGASGLALHRPVQPGAFFDVVGRRSAVFGYEDRPFEAWVYPLKVLDDFTLAFSLEGYPLEIDGRDVIRAIEIRPEATSFTYAHAAFTVRETLFTPIDEPGIVILLDIQTTRPMRVTASFRPRLRLMWPAGLMTANVGWDAATQRYTLTEESGTFAAVVGSPGSRDLTLMPYQEEPRDVPLRFAREISLAEAGRALLPIVIAGGVKGKADAEAMYDRLLDSVPALYERNVRAYRALADRTTDLQVPDARVVDAFRWAKVGVEKGVATNPYLGTGLVAGFRTSGESERPGFAWFFGRDALWTALAIDAYGDFAATRTALAFLAKYQRADGKIPHEVSQSASLVPWFDKYPYAWASADATPLFIVAHAEHWRTSGDRAFLDTSWNAIVKAYQFSSATDADGDGLIENTNVGHGWVEGGALYPPHEELYLQGVWLSALEGLEELARARGDSALAGEAHARAAKTREAIEARYWLPDRGYYAFATARNGDSATERLVEEDTVLPAVPLWWGLLRKDRADRQIDRLGSGDLATDWGTRILSSGSRLYDPLSYHYGSVWPLFTGWASMAAYRYGRPHVGYQSLMANALLTFDGALGYVTELLSGAFNAAFGRSSHHQVWSEAMVVTPLVRGLFGVRVEDGGRVLRVQPQLPADWDRASLRKIAAGGTFFDADITRAPGRLVFEIRRRPETDAGAPAPQRLVVAPAFPLDARIQSVRVGGRVVRPRVATIGDVQFAEIGVDEPSATTRIEYVLRDGSDVYVRQEPADPGDDSRQVRILRSRGEDAGLRLTLEGRGGRTYALALRTPRRIGPPTADGVKVETRPGQDAQVLVTFAGPADQYVRREVLVPLSSR
jgi:mannosylglycerate hydrolase MGH1-like protein